ncbi:YchJ family protein [Aestuariirhabdus sp. LZHN29]|uniref:YchJ family protein n=1 Tax=Aestuariirhabdus sp. LZHN29 TaxID=3417462 RepID=UPI003CF4C5EE
MPDLKPLPSTCPCHSGSLYSDCCAPLHRKSAQPRTATQLMRSRYSAFALGDIDYLVSTTRSDQRALLDRSSLADWLARTRWLRLEILSAEAGTDTDRVGRVEFNAWYRLDGKDTLQCHHEHSSFVREHNRWVFVDPTIDAPAIGRNAPCPCGSGKKYKRCCDRP